MANNHTAPDINTSLSALITAFHILHHHHILDSYGHISIRDPSDPSRFFTSTKPANLISSAADIDHWNVGDGTAVRKPSIGTSSILKPSPYSEHWIHSSMYEKYPDVMSVVHSHSPVMVAQGLQKHQVPPRAMYHMAGFMGSGAPIFDAAKHYPSMPLNTKRNMLINNKTLGDALARAFCINPQPWDRSPDEAVVLQRGHGFVTWATNIQDAVYRAVFAVKNAEIQMQALELQMASGGKGGLAVLGAQESEDCASTFNEGSRKAWPSWRAEVERSSQYINEMKV